MESFIVVLLQFVTVVTCITIEQTMKRRKEQDDNDEDTEMLESIHFPISIIDDDDDDTNDDDDYTKATKLPLVEISLEPGGWDDLAIVHCFNMSIHQHDQYDKSTFTFIPRKKDKQMSIQSTSNNKDVPSNPKKENQPKKEEKNVVWKPQKVPLPQWAIDPVFATVELKSSD